VETGPEPGAINLSSVVADGCKFSPYCHRFVFLTGSHYKMSCGKKWEVVEWRAAVLTWIYNGSD